MHAPASISKPAAPGKAGRYPGDPGVWIVILGELAMFGLFFVLFVHYRAQNIEMYVASQRSINSTLGLVNTLLLLTSSCLVALAVQDIREQSGVRARPFLLGAIACGIGFCGVKAIEYGEKLRLGITPSTNEFYAYYYVFTGIHLGHVLVGLALLGLMYHLSGAANQSAARSMIIESCGLFWHLVDIVWIFLFAIFYLAR